MIIQIVDYIIGQIIYTATLTMYTPDNAAISKMAKIHRTNILKPLEIYCHKEYLNSDVYFLEVVANIKFKKECQGHYKDLITRNNRMKYEMSYYQG